MSQVVTSRNRIVDDPPIVKAIFGNTRYAWVFVPVRLFLAYQWLNAGWGKLNNPKWIETGEALQSYWVNALRLEPRPVIVFDWYRAFIQLLVDTNAYTWFSKVIIVGEFLVGFGLLLGAFTGIAAFGGTLLNVNFLLAGTVSTNPVLFGLATFVVLGWKVAGYWGLDRFLLPALGVPWRTIEAEVPAARDAMASQPRTS